MAAVSWSDSTGPTLLAIPTWMLPLTRWPRCTVHPNQGQGVPQLFSGGEALQSDEDIWRLNELGGEPHPTEDEARRHGDRQEQEGHARQVGLNTYFVVNWRASNEGSTAKMDRDFCIRSELKGGISGRSLQVGIKSKNRFQIPKNPAKQIVIDPP